MARAKTPRTHSRTQPVETASTAPAAVPESNELKTNSVIPINTESRKKPSADVLDRTRLEEKIRQRAYELYLQRGCTPGRENEDWLIAEGEILTNPRQHTA